MVGGQWEDAEKKERDGKKKRKVVKERWEYMERVQRTGVSTLTLPARRRLSFFAASNSSVCSSNSPLSLSNYVHMETHVIIKQAHLHL